MHGLEAVANLRQRAADIHRHGVVQVGLAHVVFDIQQRGFVAMRFVAVGFSHLNRDSHEFPELVHLKFRSSRIAAAAPPTVEFSEQFFAMQFAPMRQQIVRERIFRMSDAFEVQRHGQILFRVARVTLAHGAIRRHDADFFVQGFPR